MGQLRASNNKRRQRRQPPSTLRNRTQNTIQSDSPRAGSALDSRLETQDFPKTLDAFLDLLRRLPGESQPDSVLTRAIDKERLTGHIGNSRLNCGRKKSARVYALRRFVKDKEAPARRSPVRAQAGVPLEGINRDIASLSVKPSQLRQIPFYKARPHGVTYNSHV